VQAYLLVVIFFLLGLGVNRFFADTPVYQKHKQRMLDLANLWIIRLALPALILRYVPNIELTPLAIVPSLVAWGWVFLSVILVLVLARVFDWRRDMVGAMLLLVPLGNTSFIGYPMTLALFNEEVLAYAIFLDQFGSFVALSVLTTVVLAIYTSAPDAHLNTRSLLGAILLKIIAFPPFLALVAALLLPLGSLTVTLQPLLSALGGSLMPLALFMLGAQFQPRLVPEQFNPLSVSIGLKMVLAPILTWQILSVIGVSTEVLQASVFEMAMPAMMTPGIMAIVFAPVCWATALYYRC